MTQYVNTEALAKWYQMVSNEPWDEQRVLNEVFQQFLKTRKEVFVLSPEHTQTGAEESYPFQMQHLNCCGADQMFISF